MNGPVFHLPGKLAHDCLRYGSETWVIPEKGRRPAGGVSTISPLTISALPSTLYKSSIAARALVLIVYPPFTVQRDYTRFGFVCVLLEPSPVPLSLCNVDTLLRLAAGRSGGRPRRAGRSKSRKACAAEALAQKCRVFCLSVRRRRGSATPSQAQSLNCSHRGSAVESMAVAVLSGLKKFRRWNIISYAMERGIYQ